MSDGATIHCKINPTLFNDEFRRRIETCFTAISMRPISMTNLYTSPPPPSKGAPLVAANYFPANPGNGTLVIIDWKECGDGFKPGDSIQVMFAGDLAGTGKTEYWEVIVHISEQSQANLVSVDTQFERLVEYDEDDRTRFGALRQLASGLHREFRADSTIVEIADGDDNTTWFEFRTGSDQLVPGKFALP